MTAMTATTISPRTAGPRMRSDCGTYRRDSASPPSLMNA
jgi:hypothetical protein